MRGKITTDLRRQRLPAVEAFEEEIIFWLVVIRGRFFNNILVYY
jgi:hypothetical protein